MKSVLICYFSGTGNTKKVVDEFAKSFQKNNFEVVLHNIDDGAFGGDISKFELFGIAYPVHAFNAPANVLEFAKTIQKLPKKTKKAYFVINSSGEPLKLNNISSIKLNSIMKKRGFVLTNEYHYCMPYNIIFRHTDNMAHKMWETAQKVIPLDCQQIVDGEKSKLGYVPFGHFLAWTFRIEHWGGKFNGKRYKVSDKCLKCGLCVKKCPAHNITIENGEFKFGKDCLMCMRCSFNCPANAIKIGLFDKWKVNGAYDFEHFDEKEEQTHKKYCKKSYEKYFDKNEKRAKPKI